MKTTDEKMDEILSELRIIKATLAKKNDAWVQTPDGEYICPKHQHVLTPRGKHGKNWHSHKVIDPATGQGVLGHDGKPLYCHGYACNGAQGWWWEASPPPMSDCTIRIESNKTPERKATEETADQLFRLRSRKNRYGDDSIVPTRDLSRYDAFVSNQGREPENQKELYMA